MCAKQITNISSGVYFREIDLTFETEIAGVFAGASIGLTEKGPAFEPLTYSTFDERVVRMGNLDPRWPSSYYARGYLNQTNNYKEVRILGLEGYTEVAEGDKGFTIMLSIPSTSPQAAVWNTPAAYDFLTSPVISVAESVAAVIKPRRAAGFTNQFTGLPEVVSVEVAPSGINPTATDEEFLLTITFADLTQTTCTASLRPERPNFIGKLFGTDPRDGTLVKGQPSPLWVEFVIPSVTRRPDPDAVGVGESPLDEDHPLAYYYPGDDTPRTTLDLVEGEMRIDLGFSYPTEAITGVTNTDPVVITVVSHPFVNGDHVVINGVTGTSPVANGDFYLGNVTPTTFELYEDSGLTISIDGTSSSHIATGTVELFYVPTWETEVLDFTDVAFQTPVTPWYVSDFDLDGEVKRLFRVWSISDGEAGNSEIKIEISDIDPSGNGGVGSFTLSVRRFDDTEDVSVFTVEAFRNLTMDRKSDNYILRRIGDGENFPIQSRYIFLELNASEPLANNVIPYGSEGFPNVAGISMPDIVWTTEYDRFKVIRKQTLGLPNNKINRFATLAKDQLAFKNIQNLGAAQGKGFHLNPQELDPTIGLGAIVSVNFDLANPTIYLDKNDVAVVPSEKIRRSKYVSAFYGGFDGFNIYNIRQWQDTNSKDFTALTMALEVMSDVESTSTDFSVLVTPDLNIVDHSNATETVLEMVVGRGDAMYISDFPFDPEANPSIARDILRFSEMMSSYNAMYFPHVQIEDDVNKENIFLAPSLIALQTIASVATNEQVWQPPAGPLRTVTNDLIRTKRRMKIGDREILKDQNINPIAPFPGSGFEITESRTTQEELSALSFIHNRLLLGYAKKAINQSLRPILHQLKTDTLKSAFINTVTPIFERIKKLSGVEEFKVSVLSVEEDRTTLHGQIEIVPLFPVERIIVDFVLKNNSTEFSA